MNEHKISPIGYETIKQQLIHDSGFIREFEKWIDKLFRENAWDYNLVMAEVCQLMSDAFWTPKEVLMDKLSILDSDHIEKIIHSLSKEYGFSFSHYNPECGCNGGWHLTIYYPGAKSAAELEIEIQPEKYLFVVEKTRSWARSEYTYKGLENTIGCWAEDLM